MTYKARKNLQYITFGMLAVLLVLIISTAMIFMTYNLALMTSENAQAKKAEKYASQIDTTEKGSVCFLGDSITEMYDLEKHFKNKNYVNRGISSNETQDILDRLDSNVIAIEPSVVVLLVGVNDLGHGVDNNTIISNYDKILYELTTKLESAKILVQSIYPTRTLSNFNSINLTKNRKNQDIINLNIEINKLAEKYNLTYVDTHSVLVDSEGMLNANYTLDGLHLNDDGYRKVSEHLKKFI